MRLIRSRQILLGAAALLVSLSGGALSASAGALPGASPALTQQTSPGSAQGGVAVLPLGGTEGPGQPIAARVSVYQDAPGPFTLGMANLPVGWTVTFTPAIVQQGERSEMFIRIGDRAQRGQYALRVTATDAAGQVSEGLYHLGVEDNTWSCPIWVNLAADGGFEAGPTSPWRATHGVITNASDQPASAGNYKAWLGRSPARASTLSQTVTLPPTCLYHGLYFDLHVDSTEPAGGEERDRLIVLANNTVLKVYSNKDSSAGYRHERIDLSAFTDSTVRLTFISIQDARRRTNFVIDEVIARSVWAGPPVPTRGPSSAAW